MNKTFNRICNRFETMQLRDQVNNIKGTMMLAADVARDKVLDLLNKCKDKTFVFTIDEDTDESIHALARSFPYCGVFNCNFYHIPCKDNAKN